MIPNRKGERIPKFEFKGLIGPILLGTLVRL